MNKVTFKVQKDLAIPGSYTVSRDWKFSQ